MKTEYKNPDKKIRQLYTEKKTKENQIVKIHKHIEDAYNISNQIVKHIKGRKKKNKIKK